MHDNGDFSTTDLEGFDLYGKTLGVIGTGNIGRNVCRIAEGFGMEVKMFDRFPDMSIETSHARYASFDDLLANSDIVTLHVPYIPENKHLLNSDAFAKMKRGAYVINTARGELIDTGALVAALKDGRVAGAGLDVLEEERALKDDAVLMRDMESIEALQALIRDHVLVDMPHVVITPHIAFSSREAYREILTVSAANIDAFIKEAPQNALRL